MQILGTVQGDCNPLDWLMLGGIVTPLTLPVVNIIHANSRDCPRGL